MWLASFNRITVSKVNKKGVASWSRGGCNIEKKKKISSEKDEPREIRIAYTHFVLASSEALAEEVVDSGSSLGALSFASEELGGRTAGECWAVIVEKEEEERGRGIVVGSSDMQPTKKIRDGEWMDGCGGFRWVGGWIASS